MFGWLKKVVNAKPAMDCGGDPTKGDGDLFFQAWSHEGELIVKLDPGMFTDTAHAGIFVADVARHFARAFVESGRIEEENEALRRIRAAFDSEWVEPTSPLEGGIVN